MMLNDGGNMKTTDIYSYIQIALKCVLIGERVVHMISNNTNTNSVGEKFTA